MNKEEKQIEYNRIVAEADQAKDRLYYMVGKLEELGYTRKAKSLMNLVYKIEYWQNTKP